MFESFLNTGQARHPVGARTRTHIVLASQMVADG
jgi:hypothetical protein